VLLDTWCWGPAAGAGAGVGAGALLVLVVLLPWGPAAATREVSCIFLFRPHGVPHQEHVALLSRMSTGNTRPAAGLVLTLVSSPCRPGADPRPPSWPLGADRLASLLASVITSYLSALLAW
jgi:hypothetical protein